MSADFIVVVLTVQIDQDIRMDYHACVPIDQGVLLFWRWENRAAFLLVMAIYQYGILVHSIDQPLDDSK